MAAAGEGGPLFASLAKREVDWDKHILCQKRKVARSAGRKNTESRTATDTTTLDRAPATELLAAPTLMR
jgi:hypothetical protein